MPSVLSLELALVWFVVGFCVGSGWALGSWLVTKIMSKLFAPHP